VVFSADGHLQGIVDADHPQIATSNGDLVIEVNLDPSKPHNLTGQLRTRDGHTRVYHADITLRVTKPVVFAKACLRGLDPVNILSMGVNGELKRFAEWLEHDTITPSNLQVTIKPGAKGVEEQTGLTIASVLVSDVKLDPIIEEAVTIRLRGDVEAAKRAEQAKQNQWELEQAESAAENKRRIAVGDAATTYTLKSSFEVLDVLKERYIGYLRQGLFPLDVEAQHPDLIRAIRQMSSQLGQPLLLPSGSPQNEDTIVQGSIGSNGYEPHIGIFVSQTSLSEEQIDGIEKRLVACEAKCETLQYFRVLWVHPTGPAAHATSPQIEGDIIQAEDMPLKEDDIIIQVEDMPLENEAAIRKYALASPVGRDTKFLILRGNQFLVLHIAIYRD